MTWVDAVLSPGTVYFIRPEMVKDVYYIIVMIVILESIMIRLRFQGTKNIKTYGMDRNID